MSHEVKKGPLRTIEADFNIFESGWKNMGNNHKYISNNVDRLINGDIVQERVQRGVMVGFFGHDSNLPMEPKENKDNLASHKTVHLKFHHQSGDVEHKQAIAQTDTGKKVLSLHDSDIGNFSWRGKGYRNFVGTHFRDDAARHLRFDYVYIPGMVNQEKRDIIQESLDDPSEDFQAILDKFKEHDLNIEESVKDVINWQLQGTMLHDIEKELEEETLSHDITRSDLNRLRSDQSLRNEAFLNAMKSAPFDFSEETYKFITGQSFEGNEQIKDAVLSFINEITAYSSIDMSQFPGRDNQVKTLPQSVFLPSKGRSKRRANVSKFFLTR